MRNHTGAAASEAPQSGPAPSGPAPSGPAPSGSAPSGSAPTPTGAALPGHAPSSARTFRHTYRGHPDQVRVLREALAHVLAGCPAAGDVVLLTDEIAINAIQHSNSGQPGGRFTVTAEICDGVSVRIQVADEGGRWDALRRTPRHASDLLEAGRGLVIVDALATAWGVTGTTAGRVVWAVLNWPPA